MIRPSKPLTHDERQALIRRPIVITIHGSSGPHGGSTVCIDGVYPHRRCYAPGTRAFQLAVARTSEEHL